MTTNEVRSADGQRVAVPGFVLWEYTHTNEDNVACFRLAGVTPWGSEVDQWLRYSDSARVLKVRQVDSQQGDLP